MFELIDRRQIASALLASYLMGLALGVSTDAETGQQTANYQNQTTRESRSQANGDTLKAGHDVLINGGQVSLSHTVGNTSMKG